MADQDPIIVPGPNSPDVLVQGNRLDEVAAWLSSIRSGAGYNKSVPFVVVPNTLTAINLEKLMPAPQRVRKAINFKDAESFISYVNTFKPGYSPRLFVNDSDAGMTVLAVLDHDVPQMFDTSEGAPQNGIVPVAPTWNEHTAKLTLSYHDDYATLLSRNEQWFRQEDFAEFVEDNYSLFFAPNCADMLELAQSLKGVKSAEFKAGKRLSNGETTISYVETIGATDGKGEINVPAALTLKCPMFEGFPVAEIPASFRWRIEGREIKFFYKLLTKQAERACRQQVKDKIMTSTEMNLLAVTDFSGIQVDRTKL